MRKAFVCPACRSKISFKYAFLLNSNSSVRCGSCGRGSTPKKMSKGYFAIGFVGTVAAAQFSLSHDRNLVKALLIGLAVGIVLYLGSVIYVYNKIEFE